MYYRLTNYNSKVWVFRKRILHFRFEGMEFIEKRKAFYSENDYSWSLKLFELFVLFLNCIKGTLHFYTFQIA